MACDLKQDITTFNVGTCSIIYKDVINMSKGCICEKRTMKSRRLKIIGRHNVNEVIYRCTILLCH